MPKINKPFVILGGILIVSSLFIYLVSKPDNTKDQITSVDKDTFDVYQNESLGISFPYKSSAFQITEDSPHQVTIVNKEYTYMGSLIITDQQTVNPKTLVLCSSLPRDSQHPELTDTESHPKEGCLKNMTNTTIDGKKAVNFTVDYAFDDAEEIIQITEDPKLEIRNSSDFDMQTLKDFIKIN